MAAIVLLLRRAFGFIVKITHLFQRLQQTNDPAIKKKLNPPSIPKSIVNLTQLEWTALFRPDHLPPHPFPGRTVFLSSNPFRFLVLKFDVLTGFTRQIATAPNFFPVPDKIPGKSTALLKLLYFIT